VTPRRPEPKRVPAPDLPILAFASAADFHDWIDEHHAASSGIWLRLAKKGSGIPSVTYAEALEEALCYGWIDALAKSEGDQTYKQKFLPRAKRSIWSKINRERAEALIASGRMQPAGLAEIERAKADGRWEAAYDSASKSTVPPDLEDALRRNKKAKAFFETLNSQNRYAVLFRIQTAKKPETRAKRIAQFVEMLAKGEKLHP
jgi:uncharacterized protein YdeI (YjbR/CyaY-like superfamily)